MTPFWLFVIGAAWTLFCLLIASVPMPPGRKYDAISTILFFLVLIFGGTLFALAQHSK